MSVGYTMISSKGYELSVADHDIIDDVFPEKFTVRNLKTLSLVVDVPTTVLINGQEISVLPDFGLHYDTNLRPIEVLKFKESDISYYYIASY